MFNYTPGPWEIDVASIRDKEKRVIAKIPCLFADNAAENTKLLAAAPELFEAVEDILRAPFGEEFDFACEKGMNLINRIRKEE